MGVNPGFSVSLPRENRDRLPCPLVTPSHEWTRYRRGQGGLSLFSLCYDRPQRPTSPAIGSSRMMLAPLITFVNLFFILCFGIAAPLRAQGYVDPGAGAMLWQILAAFFIGAVFLFRKLLFRWFRKRRPPE